MSKMKKPLWAEISWLLLGLHSIETRKGAMTLFLAFIACSVICIPVSYYLQDWSWAGFMFAFSLWLWICILWGDKNTVWKTNQE